MLSEWLVREEKFFQANGRYSTELREVSIGIGRATDVVLVADPDGPVRWLEPGRPRASFHDTVLVSSSRAAKAPPSVLPAIVEGRARVGIEGKCPTCVLTLACLENLDADSDYSVWSISSADRVTARGEMIRSAQPWLEHDDESTLEGAAPYAEVLR